MSAVTLRATLRADAHVTTQGADRAALYLLLQVDGCRTGALATQHYRAVGAGWMARTDALRLRKGVEVTVWCAGFGADAAGRLRLFGVDHIAPHVDERAAA